PRWTRGARAADHRPRLWQQRGGCVGAPAYRSSHRQSKRLSDQRHDRSGECSARSGRRPMKSFRLGLSALVLLLGAGCMVGPDYSKPSVPMTAGYKEDQGWKLARPLDQIPRGNWWEILGDPKSNALEEQVSEANQNVKVAEARFRQARALIGFFRAGLFPLVTAGASASSLRNSPNRTNGSAFGGASSRDFLLTGDVSYEIDLWGRIRRSVT